MSKPVKIILIIVLIFVVVVVAGVAMLFRWGRGRLENFSGEGIIQTIVDRATEEGFDLSFDEDNGFSISSEDGDSEISFSEDMEMEKIGEIYGIRLPDIELAQLMRQREQDGFSVMYQTEIEDIEAVKDSYIETLESEGWHVKEDGFYQEAYYIFLNKEEEGSLQVYLSEDQLMITHDKR